MHDLESIALLGRLPDGVSRHFLHPGHLFAADTPCVVTTILGSCVAVCLWDARSLVAGMNHYMLPYWSSNGNSSSRFGNVAIEQLIKKVLALGAERARLQAKLFGGARVIKAVSQASSDLGAKNIELARQILQQEGLPVIAEDVGGDFGRKLIFDTASGSVFVKRLERF